MTEATIEYQSAVRGRTFKQYTIFFAVYFIIFASCVFFLSAYIVPHFVNIFRSTHQVLPPITMMVVRASEIFNNVLWMPMLMAFAALPFLLAKLVISISPRYRKMLETAITLLCVLGTAGTIAIVVLAMMLPI